MRLNREAKRVIKEALREDIGREDITTLFTIPVHTKTRAVIIAKEKGVLCGVDIVKAVFNEIRGKVRYHSLKSDGHTCRRDEKIIEISGDARTILAGERVALNFLSMLSGVASTTRAFVEATRGTHARILDTRKTTPTLRYFEKYAVRTGGGYNHRKSLGEAILVKDNHLRAGKFLQHGRLDAARMKHCIKCLRALPNTQIEIEVETLDELSAVIQHKPDIVMLDNFEISQMRKAVKFRNKNFPGVKLEASGGVNLKTVRRIALTGVDFISIGSITHSARAIDFSLEIAEV